MIKPIVYHSIEEKEALEEKLMAAIPVEKRKSAATELMNIFYKPATNIPSRKNRKLKLK